MASIHALPRSVAKRNEERSDDLEGVVDDALSAIARLGRAAGSASGAERDRLARAAAVIDDGLARTVRAIHNVPDAD